MLKSMLVLSVLLTLGVHDCQSTDPLLLEYSDYYYDLYYGDYDDYSPDTEGSGKYFHRISGFKLVIDFQVNSKFRGFC